MSEYNLRKHKAITVPKRVVQLPKILLFFLGFESDFLVVDVQHKLIRRFEMTKQSILTA